MAEDQHQDRTEKPTPKRKQDARRKGQVAQSKEVAGVLILMLSLTLFTLAGAWMFAYLSQYLRGAFETIASAKIHEPAGAEVLLIQTAGIIFKLTLPVMGLALVAGLAGNVAQFGFVLSGHALTPKLSKLNPVSGLKRLFSLRSLVELIKSLLKIVLIGGVAFVVVQKELQVIPTLPHQSVFDILFFVGRVAFKIFFYVTVVLLVLAGLDYAYQRWEHERELKMTRQEVKDELKQTEGDPRVKARIRSIQMETARKRMLEAVPDADVVITNPTHLAVALQFDADTMAAPCVVAKGAGSVAERIRKIAAEHAIPVVENKPLAQTLFKTVDIGGSIPVELYRAVAEILAYVYRLKGFHPGG
jgi:flagellar biosynthetic protein FlhB